MTDQNEKDLEQAAIVAHQMKSPLGTLQSIVRTLLGGFAGDLTEKQASMLEGADRKCSEAMDTVRTLLTLSEVRQKAGEDQAGDITAALHQAVKRHREEAMEHDITLHTDIAPQAAWVKLEDDPLIEALSALVHNAVKYTPEGGHVRVRLQLDEDQRNIWLTVADSGIGIPEDEKDRLFAPFFRASNARNLEPSGTGLGLPFIKTVVESGGGSITLEDSELGGAKFAVKLPVRSAPQPAEEKQREASFRAVVIGGVAAGPKIAAKIKRDDPRADVTIVERGRVLSYAGCGLPYYISGQITDQRKLVSTPEGVLKGPEYFERVKSVRVMNRTEAVEIDRDKKRVRIRDLNSGEENWLPYDKLALATGAHSVVPDLSGINLDNIYSLHSLEHAEGIKSNLATYRAKDVTIVGGGLIGVEMTESLVAAGCRVTLIEQADQLLPQLLDAEMGALVRRHFEEHGVRVELDTRVDGFEGDTEVESVITENDTIATDVVILGTGVQPNVELAEQADLDIGETGAVAVDQHMCTSDPDIYAAGDCAESHCLVTGEPTYIPLGSTANKQGRVAAINMAGGDDTFPGICRTTICKVFDYTVARAGLTEEEAENHNYQVASVIVPGLDRAHFMPDARIIVLKLVVDADSGRLLGVQAVGEGEAAKRVDVAVTAITGEMSYDTISKLDLCYAPSYSEALDNIHTACNVLQNKMRGQFNGITPSEVQKKICADAECVLLDVRTPEEYRRAHIPGSKHIPLNSLRGRLAELPKDRELILFSRVSLGAYEAARILQDRGFSDVKVMEGGFVVWPYSEQAGPCQQ